MFRSFFARHSLLKCSLVLGTTTAGLGLTYSRMKNNPISYENSILLPQESFWKRTFVSYADGQWVRSWWGNSKYTFENGIIYEGPYVANLFEGSHVGKLSFPNGHNYEGEFMKGYIPNGKGKLIANNKEIFEGEFKNGAPHGKIKYSCPDGYVFEGDYVEGRKHGHGKYRTSQGIEFEGEFRNGIRHGYGKEVAPNGNCFEGEFQRGHPHGHGKHISPDGTTYEGEFVEGSFSGRGRMVYPSGNVFEGIFIRNQAYKGKLITSAGEYLIDPEGKQPEQSPPSHKK